MEKQSRGRGVSPPGICIERVSISKIPSPSLASGKKNSEGSWGTSPPCSMQALGAALSHRWAVPWGNLSNASLVAPGSRGGQCNAAGEQGLLFTPESFINKNGVGSGVITQQPTPRACGRRQSQLKPCSNQPGALPPEGCRGEDGGSGKDAGPGDFQPCPPRLRGSSRSFRVL